ncbi:hypothetical protein EAE99_007835 [Botrytis elliptica]|nr:hypothetical protein EAE99_007835 [Botrytis elliptica]
MTPRRKPTPIAPPDPLKTRSNSSVLTLPFPRENVGQGRKTSAQSQSLLLSSLPIEIRMLIWEVCIGGNTFHLSLFRFGRRGRHSRFTHRLCLCEGPELPLKLHNYCYHNDRRFCCTDKVKALSLIVTCRQIYSETIGILYSTNVFRTQNFCAQHLQKTLLPQRYNCIRVLHLENVTRVTEAFVEDPKHRNETLKEWTDTWKALAGLPGLQILHVQLFYCQFSA